MDLVRWLSCSGKGLMDEILSCGLGSAMEILCCNACDVRQDEDKPDLLCQNHAVVRGLFLSSARIFHFPLIFLLVSPSKSPTRV